MLYTTACGAILIPGAAIIGSLFDGGAPPNAVLHGLGAALLVFVALLLFHLPASVWQIMALAVGAILFIYFAIAFWPLALLGLFIAMFTKLLHGSI